MNLYEQIKNQLTPKHVTERYGPPIHRGDMICCPFHDDKTPSMKLYDDHFYCFGCQKSGDVIDLAAQFLRLTNHEAAKRLAADFGICNDSAASAIRHSVAYEQTRQFHEDEQECYLALLDYLKLLELWEQKYSPTSQIATPDPRFIEACQMKSYVEYLCDIFITGSTKERFTAIRELKPYLDELRSYTAQKNMEEKAIGRNKRIHPDLAV